MRATCLLVWIVAAPLLGQAPALRLHAPRGLIAPVPGADTFRPEVAALGRSLFFDPELSIDRTTACSRCHLPEHGFASVQALPPGSLGKHALRNAPTLYNRAWGKSFSWDGKAATLEEQVILPISNPNEMALPLDQAIGRLREHPSYGQRFVDLFGHPAASQDLAAALAAYVRTLVHGGTVIDQFRAGLGGPLTRAERAGLWIYESKGGCWKCHDGGNFTDEEFHNTGVGARSGIPLPGRMAISKDPSDAGKFKTPTLRALTQTAPYMHDGSQQTLEDVVAFYRRGGNANSHLDPRMRSLDLTNQEASHLVAFLRGLSRLAPKKTEGRESAPPPRRK